MAGALAARARQLWDHADPTGKVQVAYVAGLYRVWDELLERHPNLMLDVSARLDFGTLRRTGSACVGHHAEDPHIRRIMQTSGARVLPGHLMQGQIYVGERDPDDATGPLELVSRLAGSFTFGGHIASWGPRQVRRVRRYLEGYRAYRHLLTKDFYRLSPVPRDDTGWDAVQFVDPATGEAVILAYRVRGHQSSTIVRPKALRLSGTYTIVDPFSGRPARTASGDALAQHGLKLSLAPESALVRHLQPVRLDRHEKK
jgi:hypothetical protein